MEADYVKKAQACASPSSIRWGRDSGQAAVEWTSLPTARLLRKAQAAVEVLAYASFFLLAFVATMALFFQMQSQELSRAEYAYAQEVAYGFSDQIHTAFVAGPGFYQSVPLAQDLLGKPYTISISRKISSAEVASGERETGFVYVDWRGASNSASSFSAPTITTSYDAVASSPSPAGARCITLDGNFIIISSTCGTINMTNRGGTIFISKA